METPVLTNSTYQNSLEFLKEHQGFEGKKNPQAGFASLDRFVRLAIELKKFSLSANSADAGSAFQILTSVANFAEVHGKEASFENMELMMRAKWNIVYDVLNKEIHFLTGSHQKIRTIRLNAFDFDGDKNALVLDMQAKLMGDVSHHFIPYSYKLNKSLIDRYYSQVPFLRGLSEEVRESTARYPETTFHRPS